MKLPDLAANWSAQAASLERWGDDRGATILRRCASELDSAALAHDDEELTITAASAASGYSRDHLRSLVASGEIPNAGRKGSPRIRRCDLPMKPGAAGLVTDLEALLDHLSEAAQADGLWKETSDDERINADILRNQLGAALDVVVRMIRLRKARGGKAVLSLADRQRRDIEGRPNVELMEEDDTPGPA